MAAVKRMLSKGALARVVGLSMALLVGGALAGGQESVDAEELKVTGLLSLHPEGGIVIDDGSTSYGVVAGMSLNAFLGTTVTLDGGIQGGSLYVSSLTSGDVFVEVQGATASFMASGTVEKAGDGFQVAAGEVVLPLVGSDELDQVAGEEADIQGQLIGGQVVLTGLRTTDGMEIETHVPAVEDTGDGEWGSNGEWGDQD